MKPILLTIMILLAFFFIIGGLEITFKPFSISMPYWYRSVGWFLITIGVTTLIIGERNNAYKDGFKNGLDKGSEIIIEAIKKRID